MVRQGILDLAARFNATALNEELPAEIIVRQLSSENLPGEFIVRRPASQELSAEFIVRQLDSQELPAEFITKQPGMEQVIFGGYYDLLSPTTTEYNSLIAGSTWTTSFGWRIKLASTDGVLKKLRVKLDGSPGAGAKYTFSLFVGGLPRFSFDIAGEDTTGDSGVNEAVITGGDWLFLRCIPNGTPTARHATWTIVFEGDNPNESLILGGAGFGLSRTAIEYGQVMCSETYYSVTENDFRQVVPTSGTIKNFYVGLPADPGTPPDAYRFTLRKNGASQSLTVTITANDTTGNDLINSFNVTAGDVLTLMIEPLNTPSTEVYAFWGMTFVADTNGESIVLGGATGTLHPTTTLYHYPTSYEGLSWQVSEYLRYLLGQVCTLKKLHILLSAPPSAGDSYIFTLRIAGADSNVVATVSGINTTGNSGALKDTVALDEYVDLQCDPVSVPDIVNAYWGFVSYIAPKIPASEDLSCKFIVRKDASQELSAKFSIPIISASQELSGEFIARHPASEKLPSEFDIRRSASQTLLAEFSSRQTGSQELPAGFIARQADSQELPAEFISRQPRSANLLSELTVRQEASTNLSSRFTIRRAGSQDLPAEFISRQPDSTGLPAEFISRQPGSQDLAASFDGQVSLNLPAGFISRQADSRELLGEFEVQRSASRDLLSEFDIRRDGSRDLAASFDGQVSLNLPAGFISRQAGSQDLLGVFIVRHPGSMEVLGEFIIRHSASQEFPGEFISRQPGSQGLLGGFISRQAGSRDLAASFDGQVSLNLPLGKFIVRQPWPLWTNRYWLNGVVQLDEARISDSFLEEIITGVMDDIKTWLIAEEIGQYSGWTHIDVTPRAIRRAATYGTVASLYARNIFGPQDLVIRVAPMDAKIFTTSEMAMEYWEAMMLRVLELYLSGVGLLRIWIDTIDEDPVFTMEDIPLYTWSPDDYSTT